MASESKPEALTSNAVQPLSKKAFTVEASNFKGGYVTNKRNAATNQLAAPSQNVRINTAGSAKGREGYIDTEIDLSSSGNGAKPYHMKRYNLTFFAVDTSIKYYDWTNEEVVDTGLTITAGTKTRFAEYQGDIYATNTTDGVFRIAVMRLDGAVTAGAGSIVVDKDGAARLSVFGLTTDNLRIQGTDEAYNAVVISTGTITLVGTASQNYSDNAIAIVTDQPSGIPKGAQVVFWKNSMNLVGVNEETSSDQPTGTLFFSDFALSTTLENIVDFSGGSSGTEMVGDGGELVAAVASPNYLYLLKTDSAHFIGVNDVNTSTGARPPQLLSSRHGCLNPDCAVDVGGQVVWATQNKRILRGAYQETAGGAVVVPDEQFDADIRELLEEMDEDQSDAFMFYHAGKRMIEFQCSIDGESITLLYENIPVTDSAGNVIRTGRWLPPDTNKVFCGKFEIDGKAYATALNDDTIFELDIGNEDNGTPIEWRICSRLVEFSDGRTTCDWGQMEVSGSIGQNSEISFIPVVNGAEGSKKTIDDSGLTFRSGEALGSLLVGDAVIGGASGGGETADFNSSFAIYPSKGQDLQLCFEGSGIAGKIDSFKLPRAKAYTSSLLTTS